MITIDKCGNGLLSEISIWSGFMIPISMLHFWPLITAQLEFWLPCLYQQDRLSWRWWWWCFIEVSSERESEVWLLIGLMMRCRCDWSSLSLFAHTHTSILTTRILFSWTEKSSGVCGPRLAWLSPRIIPSGWAPSLSRPQIDPIIIIPALSLSNAYFPRTKRNEIDFDISV